VSFCVQPRRVRDRSLATAIDTPRFLSIVPKQDIVGVRLGAPDLDSPVNRFQRERAALEEPVTWVE
jgi:hypothetical protein